MEDEGRVYISKILSIIDEELKIDKNFISNGCFTVEKVKGDKLSYPILRMSVGNELPRFSSRNTSIYDTEAKVIFASKNYELLSLDKAVPIEGDFYAHCKVESKQIAQLLVKLIMNGIEYDCVKEMQKNAAIQITDNSLFCTMNGSEFSVSTLVTKMESKMRTEVAVDPDTIIFPSTSNILSKPTKFESFKTKGYYTDQYQEKLNDPLTEKVDVRQKFLLKWKSKGILGCWVYIASVNNFYFFDFRKVIADLDLNPIISLSERTKFVKDIDDQKKMKLLYDRVKYLYNYSKEEIDWEYYQDAVSNIIEFVTGTPLSIEMEGIRKPLNVLDYTDLIKISSGIAFEIFESQTSVDVVEIDNFVQNIKLIIDYIEDIQSFFKKYILLDVIVNTAVIYNYVLAMYRKSTIFVPSKRKYYAARMPIQLMKVRKSDAVSTPVDLTPLVQKIEEMNDSLELQSKEITEISNSIKTIKENPKDDESVENIIKAISKVTDKYESLSKLLNTQAKSLEKIESQFTLIKNQSDSLNRIESQFSSIRDEISKQTSILRDTKKVSKKDVETESVVVNSLDSLKEVVEKNSNNTNKNFEVVDTAIESLKNSIKNQNDLLENISLNFKSEVNEVREVFKNSLEAQTNTINTSIATQGNTLNNLVTQQTDAIKKSLSSQSNEISKSLYQTRNLQTEIRSELDDKVEKIQNSLKTFQESNTKFSEIDNKISLIEKKLSAADEERKRMISVETSIQDIDKKLIEDTQNIRKENKNSLEIIKNEIKVLEDFNVEKTGSIEFLKRQLQNAIDKSKDTLNKLYELEKKQEFSNTNISDIYTTISNLQKKLNSIENNKDEGVTQLKTELEKQLKDMKDFISNNMQTLYEIVQKKIQEGLEVSEEKWKKYSDDELEKTNQVVSNLMTFVDETIKYNEKIYQKKISESEIFHTKLLISNFKMKIQKQFTKTHLQNQPICPFSIVEISQPNAENISLSNTVAFKITNSGIDIINLNDVQTEKIFSLQLYYFAVPNNWIFRMFNTIEPIINGKPEQLGSNFYKKFEKMVGYAYNLASGERVVYDPEMKDYWKDLSEINALGKTLQYRNGRIYIAGDASDSYKNLDISNVDFFSVVVPKYLNLTPDEIKNLAANLTKPENRDDVLTHITSILNDTTPKRPYNFKHQFDIPVPVSKTTAANRWKLNWYSQVPITIRKSLNIILKYIEELLTVENAIKSTLYPVDIVLLQPKISFETSSVIMMKSGLNTGKILLSETMNLKYEKSSRNNQGLLNLSVGYKTCVYDERGVSIFHNAKFEKYLGGWNNLISSDRMLFTSPEIDRPSFLPILVEYENEGLQHETPFLYEDFLNVVLTHNEPIVYYNGFQVDYSESRKRFAHFVPSRSCLSDECNNIDAVDVMNGIKNRFRSMSYDQIDKIINV